MSDKPPDPPPQDIGTIARAARTKQFKNLLEKIRKGSISPSEMKVFAQLEGELTRDAAKADGKGRVVKTAGQVADYVGRTERTIGDWIRSGMPVLQNAAGFDLDAIDRWMETRKKAPARKGKQQEQNGEFWQTEYRKNKAKLSEIELKLRRGDLLPKADVITAFREMQTYVKKHLLLIPRIAPDRMTGLSIQDQKALLTELVETILTSMARGESAQKVEQIIT